MLKGLTSLVSLIELIVKGVISYVNKKEQDEIRDNPFKSWNTCFGVHVESKSDASSKTDTGEQQGRGRGDENPQK